MDFASFKLWVKPQLGPKPEPGPGTGPWLSQAQGLYEALDHQLVRTWIRYRNMSQSGSILVARSVTGLSFFWEWTRVRFCSVIGSGPVPQQGLRLGLGLVLDQGLDQSWAMPWSGHRPGPGQGQGLDQAWVKA